MVVSRKEIETVNSVKYLGSRLTSGLDPDLDKHVKMTRSLWNVNIRKLFKIPWTNHVRNDEELRNLDTERELITSIQKRKSAYLGSVLRNDRAKLLKIIIECKIGFGRCKHPWLKNIRDWTRLTYIIPSSTGQKFLLLWKWHYKKKIGRIFFILYSAKQTICHSLYCFLK